MMVTQPLKTISSQEDSPEPPPAKKRLAQFLKNTEMCKHYSRGYCRFADKCSYAHEMDELMTRPDFAKTRVCAYFLAGRCVNDNCSFAHDEEEKHQSSFKDTESQALCDNQQPGHQACSTQPSEGSIQSVWDDLLIESVNSDKAPFFDKWSLKSSLGCTNSVLGRQSSWPLISESELSLSSLQHFALEELQVPRDVHELLLSMSKVLAPEPKALFSRNGEADVKQTGAQRFSSRQELHEWLRVCDNADQLSDTMEHEIAELFLSDTELSAIFPRLAQQCMWRVRVLSL